MAKRRVRDAAAATAAPKSTSAPKRRQALPPVTAPDGVSSTDSSQDHYGDLGGQHRGYGQAASTRALVAEDGPRKRQRGGAIEDYGDSATSSEVSFDGDEMGLVGDDGNFMSASMSSGSDGEGGFGGLDSEGEPDDSDAEGFHSTDESTASGGLVHVDFGVYDMASNEVDAIMHLMDQFCPDKMNEIDRDCFGAVLAASPFTSVVKVTTGSDLDAGESGGDDDDDEEEAEIYGLVSILDVAHGVTSHPASLGSLAKLLKESVWQLVAPGLPPVEMLLATEKESGDAKCVLLVSEYIRNVPLELTSQLLGDTVERFEAACKSLTSSAKKSKQKGATNPLGPLQPTFPCLFAILSKVQRAVDAVDRATASATPGATGGKKKIKKARLSEGGSTIDMNDYIFWREEDAVMYEYRDKRIATAAYRCRPQYDGQPESEIPLSLLYILPFGGLVQSISEIRRKESTEAVVTRY